MFLLLAMVLLAVYWGAVAVPRVRSVRRRHYLSLSVDRDSDCPSTVLGSQQFWREAILEPPRSKKQGPPAKNVEWTRNP